MDKTHDSASDGCTCANLPRFGSPTGGKGVVGWDCAIHGPMQYRREQPTVQESTQGSLPHGWIEGKCKGCGHALKAPIVNFKGEVYKPNVYPESCWRCATDE